MNFIKQIFLVIIIAVFSNICNAQDIHFSQLGLEEIPVCGQTKEVLRHHQLDDYSIAERITDEFKNI